MSKIFVFGTAHSDAKGKNDERGTVAVKASTLPEAQAVFEKAKGPKDPRRGIARLPRSNEHVNEVIHAPDVKTERLAENKTRVDVGDVTVHVLPEPAPDTAGNVAQVFADIEAGKLPKPAKARSSAPKKSRGKKAPPQPGA